MYHLAEIQKSSTSIRDIVPR